MSKEKAITLAVFTFWPYLYMGLFICAIFVFLVTLPSGESQPSGPPVILMILIPLHLLTMIDILVLMVIYILHAFKNDQVDQEKKWLWAAVLFFGSIWIMPVYWYLYIWKDVNRTDPTNQSNQSDLSDRAR